MAAAFFLVTTSLLAAAEEEKNKESEFVAKVNGATISRKDFDQSFAIAKQQFAGIGYQQDTDADSADIKLEKEVLDRLIDTELLLQDSKERKVVVEDADFNEFYDAYRKQFKDEKQFNEYLQKNDFSEQELKKQFRNQLVIRKLQYELSKEMSAKITKEDEEVKTFYDKNIEQFKKPEKVKARHILITVDPKADEETKKKARETIEGIKKKISEGADFAELAGTSSQCSSSSKGGDLGFFTKETMVEPFAEAAFKLQPGEISDVVETQFGYHLILMEERIAAGTAPYEEVKEDIRKLLIQAELEQAQLDYIQGLRDKAEIKKFL